MGRVLGKGERRKEPSGNNLGDLSLERSLNFPQYFAMT